MSRARRRRVTGLAPAAVMLGSWGAMGTPGGTAAAAVLAGLCVVSYPLAALSSPGIPACLVTPRTRAGWRHRRPRPSHVVPEWMRRLVLRADRRRCVMRHGCSDGLEVDHVRPYAGGGLAWMWNLRTLCTRHNQVKSDYWRDRDGYEHYHPRPGYSDIGLARDVLRAEKRARWYPLRYLIAVLAVW